MNYENTNIPVEITVNDDLTGATVSMRIRKPDRTVADDTNVTVTGSKVSYLPSEPYQKGVYSFQVSYVKDGILYKSDIVTTQFYREL
jgi:hypothetical protein